MSTDEQLQPEAEEPAGEERQMSERTAKAILVVIAVGVMWGLVAAFQWIAYVVVGVLGTIGWQKTAQWIGRRRGDEPSDDEQEQAAERRETLPETLHRLANPHVFIADLAAATSISKEAARAVLESHGIRVRRAVRNGDDTGVGVHRDDIPPLPRPLSATPVDGVDQGQPTNQQGVTVEKMGLPGYIVRDPADAVRRHRVE